MKLESASEARALGFLFHRERGGEAYLMKACGCSRALGRQPGGDTAAPRGHGSPPGRSLQVGGASGRAPRSPASAEAARLARCHPEEHFLSRES